MKQEYSDKLDRLLSSDNHDPKLFWKTSKQVLNLKKSSNAIPTLKMNNEFAVSDQQKVEMLNHYFASQTQVDDSNKALLYLEPSPYNLESITISRQDVEDVLQHLNVSKASGPDLTSPAFSKKEQMCLLYHTPLYSTVPSNRDTSQTLGKKPTFRLFLKRMKISC